jgi:hypothetical protein
LNIVQLFSSGIPAAQVKQIEANRDRIQAWFDNTPQYHRIDAVHATGVKFPNFILCWGGNLGVENIALNVKNQLILPAQRTKRRLIFSPYR